MILKLFRGPIDSIRLATDDDVHVKSKKYTLNGDRNARIAID